MISIRSKLLKYSENNKFANRMPRPGRSKYCALVLKDKAANFGEPRFHQHSVTIASAIHRDLEKASPVAERAFTSRPTLQKIEAGDANVGIGIYAAVFRRLACSTGWKISPISAGTVSDKHWRVPICPNGPGSGARRRWGAMADIEVHVDFGGETRLVGLARQTLARGAETVVFEYAEAWLGYTQAFALEPALPLTRGSFPPARNQAIFGSLGDSAPDNWGRQLM